MKLFIQVPCFNESESLPAMLAELPRSVAGFESVQWLIVDDGSRDSTVTVARACGVDHVVSLRRNRGLARAFAAGVDACVRLGADVIVNTDADAQYDARDIPALVAPLLAGHADVVIGDRQPGTLEHFSPLKRLLQGLGSRVVRWLSATDVPDATSGFRAFTREAAMKINVLTEFSYTLESIIQAGHIRLSIAHIPIRARETKRKSRLFRSMPAYILHSLRTLSSVVLMYRPLRVFAALAAAFTAVGVGVGSRFLYFFASGDGAGHMQSLLLSVLCIVMGAQLLVAGLVAHLLGRNRGLIEEVLWRVRRLEADRGAGAPPPT